MKSWWQHICFRQRHPGNLFDVILNVVQFPILLVSFRAYSSLHIFIKHIEHFKLCAKRPKPAMRHETALSEQSNLLSILNNTRFIFYVCWFVKFLRYLSVPVVN